jgi:hypothetical protein
MPRMKRGDADARRALVSEVNARTARVTVPDALTGLDCEAFARKKVAPMVCDLFPVAERQTILDVLDRSLVFLTPDTIEAVLNKSHFFRRLGALQTSTCTVAGQSPWPMMRPGGGQECGDDLLLVDGLLSPKRPVRRLFCSMRRRTSFTTASDAQLACRRQDVASGYSRSTSVSARPSHMPAGPTAGSSNSALAVMHVAGFIRNSSMDPSP